MRTTIINKKSEIKPKWFIIDADNKPIGRLASKVATLLRGKWRANYSPDTFFGDHVIVINSDKAILTGRKTLDKVYYHHTGWMGGIKETPFLEMKEKHPDMPIKKAVWGMLPKNRIGRKMYLSLKVYSDENHPHIAQKPEKIDL
ncbi:MAG: 50S ribosomal protein L13 [bacterium]